MRAWRRLQVQDNCGSHALVFFFQAEDGIRYVAVTGVQTCALPIWDFAIYRRFEWLSARNLLYLQSELLSLEQQIKGYDEEDKRSILEGVIDEQMEILQDRKSVV